MAKPLLTFERKERAFVTIYGENYYIRDRDELGVAHLAELDALMQSYGLLIQRAHEGQRLTVDEGKALDPAIDRLCRVFLEAPDAVHDELSPGQRMQLVAAFNTVLPPAPATAPRNRAERRAERPSISARSPRSSSASTEATPSAG